MQLREDYPDSPDPEEECKRNYIAFKMPEEFERLRPAKLDSYQQQLLSLFYKARKHAEEMKPIPYRVMQKVTDTTLCDADICEYIIAGIDDHFLSLCSAKVKRDIENMKKGK